MEWVELAIDFITLLRTIQNVKQRFLEMEMLGEVATKCGRLLHPSTRPPWGIIR